MFFLKLVVYFSLDRSVAGGSMMSLMTAYDSNPYATDLPRESYMPIARNLSRIACPQCQI